VSTSTSFLRARVGLEKAADHHAVRQHIGAARPRPSASAAVVIVNPPTVATPAAHGIGSRAKEMTFSLCSRGSLDIELRDKTLTLTPGEIYVVPKGSNPDLWPMMRYICSSSSPQTAQHR
jgi:hypothetical protein